VLCTRSFWRVITQPPPCGGSWRLWQASAIAKLKFSQRLHGMVTHLYNSHNSHKNTTFRFVILCPGGGSINGSTCRYSWSPFAGKNWRQLSFCNRLVDASTPIEHLVQNPVQGTAEIPTRGEPVAFLGPMDIFWRAAPVISRGIIFNVASQLEPLINNLRSGTAPVGTLAGSLTASAAATAIKPKCARLIRESKRVGDRRFGLMKKNTRVRRP